MKHYGDITKMDGSLVEPVDIVTFGAPCQDLSVAGKRAGMKNAINGDEETTRSGLFYDAVRVITEMRDADVSRGRTVQFIRPRFAVYENVPGALSSNGGADWAAVITSLIQIADPNAPAVPVPETGKWLKWGGYMGEGQHGRWSIAYRIHDAQFYGVAQRRRRVCVLADFGGWSASRILFDPELRRDAEESDTDEAVGYFGGMD